MKFNKDHAHWRVKKNGVHVNHCLWTYLVKLYEEEDKNCGFADFYIYLWQDVLATLG